MVPWFEFLETEPMQPIVRQYSRLYLKIQWPYLNRRYSARQRLAAIRCHYEFLLRRLPLELREALLGANFLNLAQWNVPELGTLSLRLSHENKFSQEGEMVLGLYQDKPERLASLLCFTVTGEGEISIGCLQGNKPVADGELSNKEFNVTLTRRLHGLRPKNLLLFTLYRLAAAYSIDHLRAVGNRRHIFRENLQADYDSFWIEAGGVLARDGMYDLPTPAPAPRNLEEVAPKKRSMYRKRYQFLDTLGREIAATLAEPRRERTIFDA